MIYVIKPSGRRVKDWLYFYSQAILYTIGSTLASALTGLIIAFLGSFTNVGHLFYINKVPIGVYIFTFVAFLYGIHQPPPFFTLIL